MNQPKKRSGAGVGRQIESGFKAKSLSMSAIARDSGVSLSMVSLVLRGKRRPTGLPQKSSPKDTPAERLAQTLGISLEELARFCDWAEKTGGIQV